MSYELNIKQLEHDIMHGNKIVLIVGAGINYSKNVRLQWNQLVNPVFKDTLRQICVDNDLSVSECKDIYKLFDIDDEDTNDVTFENCNKFKSLKSRTMFDYSAPTKMSIAKSVLRNQYLYKLQDIIYSQCNRDIIKSTFQKYYSIENNDEKRKQDKEKPLYTLYTVARMILLNPNIVGVITYNYDNFLTQAINILQDDIALYFKEKERLFIRNRYKTMSDKSNGKRSDTLKVIDVYGNKNNYEAKANTFYVFHPHGFIPPAYETENLDKYRIVLSQDEYNDTTWETYSWANDTQVHLICHYTSLIIGSSFSDFTTQRILHYANKNGNKCKRYYFGSYPQRNADGYDRVSKAEINLAKLKFKYLESIGLTPVIHKEGFVYLFDKLNEINTKFIEENNK